MPPALSMRLIEHHHIFIFHVSYTTTTDDGINNDLSEVDNDDNAKGADNSDDKDFIEAENDDDVDNNDLIKVENAYEFVENHLRNYVENKLLKPDEKNQCLLHIPNHLTSFIKQQLDGIQSIVPIDYRNTGIIQTNTAWPDGLHQFLQIKHKLRISAESLTTNFLSNVGYFRCYDKNCFGFTGTLGSKDVQELIRHIYNVDFVIVPPYKYTQFKAFPDKLIQCEQEWLNECTKSIIDEAKINQRAVLVICETKSDVTKIYEKLLEKEVEMKKQIKLYTRSTDIGTTRQIEENGDLHVLVTFLPLNTRVEHQAFGRTSQQGIRGTAQLIIRGSSDSTNKNNNMGKLKQERDEHEKQDISRAKTIELKRIKMKDSLFEQYCDLRQTLRERENNTYKLDCVEELWGFWLKNMFANKDESDNHNETSFDEKFAQFRSKIINDYRSNDLFQNPFYLILKANEYIFERKNYDDASHFLRDAIKIDPIFTVNARYNLAYALIKQENTNKTQAKGELDEALKIIEETLIPQQETMLISFRICNVDGSDNNNVNHTTNNVSNTKSDIKEQVMNRINLLYLFKSQIEQVKPAIEDAESKDSRKEPTPWLSIITVGLIGIAQAVAGAALIAFTCGAAATIGTMLLSEGIDDMITAIKSAITGEFSWKEYAIQKAISIAITIATCGMSALKETRQAVKSGFKYTANLVTGKTASVVGKQALGQLTKEGWKLVGKQVAIGFVKASTKEILKTVLDKTILSQLSEKISQEISDYIKGKISDEVSNNQLTTDLLTVDSSLNRHTCENEIEILTSRILHPQNNQFAYIASSIAKGILSKLTNGVSARALQVLTAGKCLADLATFLNNFLDEFRRNLNKLRETLKIDHLLHTTNPTTIDDKTAKEMMEHLKRDKYVEHNGMKITKQLDASVFVLDKHKKHETYVIQVCNDIYTETTKKSDYAFQKSTITKTLTDQLANYMTNRLNSELINPAVHTGVDGIVDHLSHKIEATCVGSNETLQKQLERRRTQNFIRQQGSIMVKEASKEQAKRIKVGNTHENSSIDPAVEKMAQNTEKDAPGNLMDMMALSAKLGRPVVIFRNGKYDMIIGDS
ncbi:unnamed protein product [Didymodactylos carnosus]|uniref:SecA family profile domain-containing protein n=1 Tax=Didymodactylos carnosus TaxID=1234261 RepID=A0A8S2TZ88_9BILA|nr:unnamed protein product [Didymodactylos carnosus]